MTKRAQEEAGISLFPFMSILVCLIGGLTLMIAILMISQTEHEQPQEELDRYRQYTEVKADAELDQAELEKLRQLMAQAEKLREESKLALQEVALLEKKQKDQAARSGAQGHQQLLAESNRLRARMAEIESELPERQAKLDELKKEVKKREAGPEEAIVQIRPGGSGVDIAPTFVECTATGVVVYEGAEPLRIRSADLSKEDGEFRKLLNRVAATPKGEIVFLLRPDAVGTYNTARDVARTHYGPKGYCKTGKLPVPTMGNIDLSVFRR